MDAPVLMQQNMPRLRDQVTTIPFRQTFLEAPRGLIEQRPSVLLTDRGVEGLENPLKVDAFSPVEGKLRAPSGRILAHHRAITVHNPFLGTTFKHK